MNDTVIENTSQGIEVSNQCETVAVEEETPVWQELMLAIKHLPEIKSIQDLEDFIMESFDTVDLTDLIQGRFMDELVAHSNLAISHSVSTMDKEYISHLLSTIKELPAIVVPKKRRGRIV